MSTKNKNLFSLICNCSIFLITLICIIISITIGVGGNMQGNGLILFRYFTIQSNVFVALISLIYVFFNIKKLKDENYQIPNLIKGFKFSATVAVMVTFTTVFLFLGFFYGFLNLIKNENFFYHLFTPLLAFITFIFFEENRMNKWISLTSLIPTFLYGFNYLMNVVILKNWEDFYNFTLGGHFRLTPFVIVIMLSLSYLLGLLTYKLQALIINKSSAK